jgi:hypothetical protein
MAQGVCGKYSLDCFIRKPVSIDDLAIKGKRVLMVN